MKSADVYHTAITILLDISDDDPEAHNALQHSLQFLKIKRLMALKHDHSIPINTVTITKPAFHKGLDEANLNTSKTNNE
jgi:hypothetical protein